MAVAEDSVRDSGCSMIECKNIEKVYQTGEIQTYALRSVSLSVSDGEFISITGPSGSGKSTLMNIIGCLDTPTSGEYRLGGEDVSTLDSDELATIRNRKIGFVFQSFHLLRRASVLRNVALPLVYAGITKTERTEHAAAALRAASFPEKFWNHLPNQLSGGMMQRVAIARALVNNPLLILADEPTGNLDTKTGDMILGTLQHLHQDEHRTIILITHESYVAQHAQRVIQVRDGSIVEDAVVPNRRVANNHSHRPVV